MHLNQSENNNENDPERFLFSIWQMLVKSGSLNVML